LEEALRLKEAKGEGEVVVCTLGAQSAKAVLKDALARGADRAIHIVNENENRLSPYQIAKTIADAIRDENADLIFTGLQSDDASYGKQALFWRNFSEFRMRRLLSKLTARIGRKSASETRARKRLVSMVHV
jgi:electron transfer flavoprotein beta subunit